MALYGMTNFTYGDVAAAFDDTQTTLSMAIGNIDRFTEFPAIAVLWNLTDYPNPHEAFQEAGDAELIELVSKSGDTFDVIIRAQDGTTGISTTSGKTYRVAIIASRSQWDKVCRAEPGGGGPFDAILQGNAGAVSNAVARFVKDNGLDDCIHSVQGSATAGDNTAHWLGDPLEPNRFRTNLLKNAGTEDTVSMILNSIEFLTLQGRDRMGILDSGPGQAGGLSIGETATFSKFAGVLSSGGATISGGVLDNVQTHVVRISAEGGPGSDDLDEINLLANEDPQGSRVLLILEPQTTAHAITVRDKFIAGGSSNISLRGSAFEYTMQVAGDQLWLLSDGTGNDEWIECWRTPREEFIQIVDSKAAPGGTFTSGAWRTRDLNTTVIDTEGLTSLAANVITIEAGTYHVWAQCPAYRVNGHVCRLQNVTDASTLLNGINAFCSSAAAGPTTMTFLHGRIFIPSGGRDLELQHQCATTKASNGFGGTTGFGPSEIYSTIQFRRFVPRS